MEQKMLPVGLVKTFCTAASTTPVANRAVASS